MAICSCIGFFECERSCISFNNPALSYKLYLMLLFSTFHAKKPIMYLSSRMKNRLTADLIGGLQNWINASAGNGRLIQL